MMINGPRLSEGIPTPRRKPAAITAPANAKLTYDKPAISTYSPNTGWTAPVGNYVPPPVNNWAQTTWNAPAQSFAPAVTNITPMAAPAPVEPPPPPKKTVDDFAKLYDSNSELAAVDSTFAEQRSLYGQLLKKYLADHDLNVKNLNEDARLGKEGIGQNRVRGLTSLNEDFAARGLGRSGLQAKEWDDSSQAFKKQETNVELQRVRGETDLNSRKNKYVGENGENGSNMSAARREAYARLVAKQDIV